MFHFCTTLRIVEQIEIHVVMKKLISILAILIVSHCVAQAQSQSFEGINYQAVIVDENGVEIPGMDISGNVIADKQINVLFSILKGSATGTIVYQESQVTNTDASGLINLVIGKGSVTGSSQYPSIADIPWGTDNYFLEVAIDTKGGSDFKKMGSQQLMTVPFALYSLNSANSISPADTIPLSNRINATNTALNNEITRANSVEVTKEVLVNKSINVTTDGTSDTKYPSVKSVKTYVDAAITIATQTLSISTNTLTISNGNSVVLPLFVVRIILPFRCMVSMIG